MYSLRRERFVSKGPYRSVHVSRFLFDGRYRDHLKQLEIDPHDLTPCKISSLSVLGNIANVMGYYDASTIMKNLSGADRIRLMTLASMDRIIQGQRVDLNDPAIRQLFKNDREIIDKIKIALGIFNDEFDIMVKALKVPDKNSAWLKDFFVGTLRLDQNVMTMRPRDYVTQTAKVDEKLIGLLASQMVNMADDDRVLMTYLRTMLINRVLELFRLN